jgi:peptidoglycan-associated lipoprotein
MRRTFLATMLVAATLMAGCGTDPVKEPTPSTPAGQDTGQSGLPPGGVEQGGEVEGAGEASLQQRIIYFDFDSYEIPAQYRDIVSAHARRLATSGAMKVRLEGHTDERGSREYNIGLGERRAQAVRRALMLQGAGDGQLVTVSYGEERPAASGSDETAYAKNRRVEIIYGG